MRLIQDNGATAQPNTNPALVKLLVKARRWWQILREGELDLTALADCEGVMPAYVTRVVRLAFLSPAVTEGALNGSLRAGVDVGSLTRGRRSPSSARQERYRSRHQIARCSL